MSSKLTNADWADDAGRGRPRGWQVSVSSTSVLYAGFYPTFSGGGKLEAVERFGEYPPSRGMRAARFVSRAAEPEFFESFAWNRNRALGYAAAAFNDEADERFLVAGWASDLGPTASAFAQPEAFAWHSTTAPLYSAVVERFTNIRPDWRVTTSRVDPSANGTSVLRFHAVDTQILWPDQDEPVTVVAEADAALPAQLRVATTYYVTDIDHDAWSWSIAETPGGPALKSERAGTGVFLLRPSEALYWTTMLSR